MKQKLSFADAMITITGLVYFAVYFALGFLFLSYGVNIISFGVAAIVYVIAVLVLKRTVNKKIEEDNKLREDEYK